MSTPDQVANLLDSIQPASDAVFDALDVAGPLLDAAFEDDGPLQSIGSFESTRTHVARALVFKELNSLGSDAMGDWSLVKNAGPNCPVQISNGAHSIRLLHTWSSDVIPPTGRNRARISYFSNSLLGDDEEALFESHNFLLLWERFGGEFTLRLVHTLGAVRLNRKPQLDLNIYLERGISFGDLAFEQRDDDLDFFNEDVEAEEGGEVNG